MTDKKNFQQILLEAIQAILIVLSAAWAANDYFVDSASISFPTVREMNAVPSWPSMEGLRPWVFRVLTLFINRIIMLSGVSLYVATRIQIIASLCIFSLAFWYLLRTFSHNGWFNFLSACTVAAAFRFILHYPNKYFYDYDTTILCTFTLGLVFMARRNWIGTLIALFLATLAKETSLFLILIFIVCYWKKLPRKEFLQVLAAQGGIYAIVRFGLMFLFRNNPGAVIENHLVDQLTSYRWAPYGWVLYIPVFLLLLPLFFKWKEKPVFLREASIILLPFFLLYIYGSAPFEFREFGECFPILYALLVWPFSNMGVRTNDAVKLPAGR